MAPWSNDKREPLNMSRPYSSASQTSPSSSSSHETPAQPSSPPTSFPSSPPTSFPPPPLTPSILASLAADEHDDGDDDDGDHPLIAFRRFADAQIGALLHGVVGLPAAFERRAPAEMENHGDEPAASSWRERRRRGRCTRDRHAEQLPEEDVESSLAGAHRRSANAAMLTHYLLHDAYSPLALENDPVLGRIDWRGAFADLISGDEGGGGGGAVPSNQPPRDWAVATAQTWAYQRPVAAARTGGFVVGFPSLHALHAPWDRGLADAMHGIEHGPRLRSQARHEQRRGAPLPAQEHDAQEPPGTELDMYERFLDGCRPAEAPRARRRGETATHPETPAPAPAPAAVTVLRAERPAARPTAPQPAASSENGTASLQREPGLVATLTTTEQVVLPDGTTHTKVALKKRFSDGREERKETVHTTHQQRQQQQEQQQLERPRAKSRGRQDAGADASAATTTQPKKKGWFWS